MFRKIGSALGRKTISRKARFEALETRRLMTVTVKQANADIFISGDSAGNHLALIEDGAGRLFIYGDTATAISGDGVVAGVIADSNAGGGREFDNGLFKNIFINLGSGSDSVEFSGLRSGDIDYLDIKTGDATGGADHVSFGQTTFLGSPDTNFGVNATAKSVSIATGSGNDVLNINALTAPSLAINTGTGNDTINIAQSSSVTVNGNLSIVAGDGTNGVAVGTNTAALVVDGNLSIVSGSGNDGVTLNYLAVGNVSGDLILQTGAGDDTISLGSAGAVTVSHGSLAINTGDATTLDTVNVGTGAAVTVAGNTAIVTGSGSDIINVQLLSSAGVAVNTGAGADQVTLNHVTSTAYIAANLGEGVNSLTISNSTGTAAVVSGGSGADTINIDTDTFVSLTLAAGDGDNVIHLNNSTISQATSINTGTGVDQVFLTAVHAESVAIYTGDGNDTLNITSASVIDHLLAKMGAGNDTFLAANSTFLGTSILDGGAGKDHAKFTKMHRKTVLIDRF